MTPSAELSFEQARAGTAEWINRNRPFLELVGVLASLGTLLTLAWRLR